MDNGLICTFGSNCIYTNVRTSFHQLSSAQGLHVGDVVVEFGSVTTSNFSNLQEIATVVQHSKEVGLLLPWIPLLCVCTVEQGSHSTTA